MKITVDELGETVSSRTFAALSDDVDSVCLVRECRDLEQFFSTDYTSALLLGEQKIAWVHVTSRI